MLRKAQRDVLHEHLFRFGIVFFLSLSVKSWTVKKETRKDTRNKEAGEFFLGHLVNEYGIHFHVDDGFVVEHFKMTEKVQKA